MDMNEGEHANMSTANLWIVGALRPASAQRAKARKWVAGAVGLLLVMLVACAPKAVVSTPISQSTAEQPPRITVDEVLARRKAGEKIIFVDAREQSVWDAATQQIPGSIRVPPDRPEQFMKNVPKDGIVVAYCT
jgi:hypothetical protein